MVIRDTADKRGRFRYATPQNTDLRFLSCGWIRLDSSMPEVAGDSGSEELSLIVTSGSGTVRFASVEAH